MSQSHKTALVTGASRGIGAAITKALCGAGIAVTAAGRSESALKVLADETGCATLALDLADMDAVIDTLSGIDVDILVNNAGVMTQSAPFAELAREELHQSVDINLKGTLAATRALLPGMIDRRRGYVFFITSMFGPYAAPNASVYAATKAGIRAFASCLRLELVGTGIRVTEIAPGRVETEFFRAAFDGNKNAMNQKLFKEHVALVPDDVAAALLGALNLPDRADINRIEITPTDQALGGMIYAKNAHSDSR